MKRLYYQLRFWIYVHIFCPLAVKRIRRKPVINVIFVIAELGMWKTENLYQAMLSHPRFNPVLRVVPTPENANALQEVVDYLNKRGYEYHVLNRKTPLQKGFKADIVFYQKPYRSCYFRPHRFYRNLNVLFCYASYGIHSILSDYICNQDIHNVIWQYYFENRNCAIETSSLMNNRGRNLVVTGVPMFDRYQKAREEYRFDWKQQDKTKKRIIYAPHFSILPDSLLQYGTFLENGQFMLEMARKYEKEIQFVFKPHPLLQPTLYGYWGKEKTDAYYAAWDSLANAKVELGQYVDLFMTSDAMIHDCSSFTNEYMFTCNPVMYLLHDNSDSHSANLNTMSRDAFELHYKGLTFDDIEKFILDVISGNDAYMQQRKMYYEKYLKPVNGKLATENIIEAILGN